MDFNVPALIRGTVAASLDLQQRCCEGAGCKVLHSNNGSQQNKEHPVPCSRHWDQTTLSIFWEQDILSLGGPGSLSDGFQKPCMDR